MPQTYKFYRYFLLFVVVNLLLCRTHAGFPLVQKSLCHVVDLNFRAAFPPTFSGSPNCFQCSSQTALAKTGQKSPSSKERTVIEVKLIEQIQIATFLNLFQESR